MNKKIFIKNRPFDVNDANDMQIWQEDALKKTMASIYSSGIVEGLSVTATTAMNLNVAIGKAFDTNYDFINVTSAQTVAISAANTQPRYDKIVISYVSNTVDNVDNGTKYGMGASYVYSQNKMDSFLIQVIKGTAAASPTVPATPAGTFALAQVYVGANVTSITSGNITDLRQYIVLNSNINRPQVVISGTAPTDTTVLWLDTNTNVAKIYKSNAWVITNSSDADTLDGQHGSYYSPATHLHDDRYYTESEIDTKLSGKSNTGHTHLWADITDKPTTFTPATHDHDSRYYTETEMDTKLAAKSDTTHLHDDRYYTESELNTSGGGGQVHYNNITNKPATFPPDAHNHDSTYYTKTQSDTAYAAKANNLSDLPDKTVARTNLGLGTMATQSTSGFATSTHNHDGVYAKGDYILTVGTTAPASPTTKNIWWDTNTGVNTIKTYNGSAWVIMNASDSSTIGGLSAGTAANNILKLDGSGLVPLANIPNTLTGKDADTVDGAHAGTGANNVLKLDTSGKVPVGNLPAGSTSASGALQLTDSTSSTSTTTAATPNSVKTAYDLANGALSKAGGTVTGVTQFNNTVTVNGQFNANASMEVGQQGAANTPYLDFHSGATNVDYDSRIMASGGNGTVGQGILNYTAQGGHNFTGILNALTGEKIPGGNWLQMQKSADTQDQLIEFLNTAGTRIGYVGHLNSASGVVVNNNTSGKALILKNDGSMTYSGKMDIQGGGGTLVIPVGTNRYAT